MQIGSWEDPNSVLELGEQIHSSDITTDNLESTAELVDRGAEAESGEGMVAKLARLLGPPEQDHHHRLGSCPWEEKANLHAGQACEVPF